MDRISHLPECIVHRILSYFDSFDTRAPPIELVRMSVLSKHWFDLTASFPYLDFRSYLNFTTHDSFFKYVHYTTSRFCHQNLTAQAFKLCTTIMEPAELDIVNRCLELVLEKGVRKLEIINLSSDPANFIPKYRLPNILLSVSVLQSLTIHGCELPSSLMLDVVKFKSLTRLSLKYLHIDDEVIKYLATSCPLLQVFKISFCRGFKRFCVCGHQNLRSVSIDYNIPPLERIDIEAPNLSDLFVSANKTKRGGPRMNLASCERLTTVSYSGRPLPNSNGFSDFLSNFPFIENLVLHTLNKCNNLKFSSHSLRTLVLRSRCDLGQIEFNTPNLVVFNYSRIFRVPWPKVRDLTYLKACMQCYPRHDYIDALWFHNLRLFWDKTNGFKVLNLYIEAAPTPKFVDLVNLKAIGLQPYELEHVKLHLDIGKQSRAFVNAVLWCCRPQSLTISFSYGNFGEHDFEVQSDLFEFIYKKLLEQEDEGRTSINIVSSSSTPFRAIVSGEKAMVTFIKEKLTLS